MAESNYHHGDLKNALIAAGVNILAHEGIAALSLRRVARRAGVSHSAPYAHFADKQALIAAISTEGFHRLYMQLESAVKPYAVDAGRQLVACGQAYIRIATDEKDIFKIMFSGILEQEKEYPEFVEISQATFNLLVEVVSVCQKAGILRPAPADLLAVAIWGQVHGLVSLALEKQISHNLLDRCQLDEILLFSLNQFALVQLTLI
jgi:AcrR family transcriptional regulator